jgi:predicted glutamine amidotransferase
MSNYSNNAVQLPAPELAATMTGSQVIIGTLLQTPVKLIFDNQGTAAVAITTNSLGLGSTWRTFPAGEALVLDDDLSAFSQGTIFYGTGASGTFSISYTYVKPS